MCVHSNPPQGLILLTCLSGWPSDVWPRMNGLGSRNKHCKSSFHKCVPQHIWPSLSKLNPPSRLINTVNTFIEKRGASMGECIGSCGHLGPGSWGWTFTRVSKRNCPRERSLFTLQSTLLLQKKVYTTQAGTERRSTIYIKALINHHIWIGTQSELKSFSKSWHIFKS